MAYIRALVMSAYKDINCLISQPKHYVVGNQKNHRNGGGGGGGERCQNAQKHFIKKTY